MTGFHHQVELHIDPDARNDRLNRIQSWCRDWSIDCRFYDALQSKSGVRMGFSDIRYAKAFMLHFGGVLVPEGDVLDASEHDAEMEELFDLEGMTGVWFTGAPPLNS